MVRVGQLLFHCRNWLFPMIWLAFLVAFTPTLAFGHPLGDLALDGLGLAVILVGLTVRVLVIGLANIPREGRKKQVSAKQLETDGLFRHVRNPLYVGNVLLFAGWLMIFHHPWAYLAGLPLVLFAYQAIIRAEEAYMEREFGEEFARYRAAVNRWIPDPRGLSRTLREGSFRTGRVLAKEYNATLLWISMALVVMAYERWMLPQLPLTLTFVLASGLTLGVVAGISGFIILLKRNKVLSGKGWVQLRTG